MCVQRMPWAVSSWRREERSDPSWACTLSQGTGPPRALRPQGAHPHPQIPLRSPLSPRTQHLHNHVCDGISFPYMRDFFLDPAKEVDTPVGKCTQMQTPRESGKGPRAPPAACPLTGVHAGHPQMSLASLRYSVWCLVATKTTVWSWGFTTLRSRWSSTAGLSSPRTWKKASCEGRAELSPSASPRQTSPPLVPSSRAWNHRRGPQCLSP